jgi:DNA-directed RNA polymerase subunit RPC12/RpoP
MTENRYTAVLRTLKISTHGHRLCPHCRSRCVFREKGRGMDKLISILGVRPYRCLRCNKVHLGFIL